MGAYETVGKSDEWHTPKYIFDALGLEFDLDVASSLNGKDIVPCKKRYTIEDDGLNSPWQGIVWMNPPFGNMKQKSKWLEKFLDHKDGIGLMPDRTSTKWFQDYVMSTELLCFVSPRIKFLREDGTIEKSPGTGTVLFAMGDKAFDSLKNSKLGRFAIPLS